MFIKRERLFDDLGRHEANRIFPENLPGLVGRAVMLFRPMAMSNHGVQAALNGAALIRRLDCIHMYCGLTN